MSNAAIIRVPDSPIAVYLHWNGGPGSVAALVEEAFRRAHGRVNFETFIGELYAVAREFFSVSPDAGMAPDYDGLNVYLTTATDMRTENGPYDVVPVMGRDGCMTYDLLSDGEPVDVADLDKYESQNYVQIKKFFAAREIANTEFSSDLAG